MKVAHSQINEMTRFNKNIKRAETTSSIVLEKKKKGIYRVVIYIPNDVGKMKISLLLPLLKNRPMIILHSVQAYK